MSPPTAPSICADYFHNTVIVDRYPIVERSCNGATGSIFVTFGIPEDITTDGGPATKIPRRLGSIQLPRYTAISTLPESDARVQKHCHKDISCHRYILFRTCYLFSTTARQTMADRGSRQVVRTLSTPLMVGVQNRGIVTEVKQFHQYWVRSPYGTENSSASAPSLWSRMSVLHTPSTDR